VTHAPALKAGRCITIIVIYCYLGILQCPKTLVLCGFCEGLAPFNDGFAPFNDGFAPFNDGAPFLFALF
jgi:hypothetical protein